MPDSRRSEHTHEHQSGDRKIDPSKIPGVNIVKGKDGQPDKIAVTEAGRERLREELED
jgi:hypothetical protein